MKHLYKYFPTPSDKMGYFWGVASIKDAVIIEYGPGGTTHYAIEGVHNINGEIVANMFTTDMDQDDVIMGDTEKLRRAILEVDTIYKPKYIFIIASSLSSVIGSDINGLIFELRNNVTSNLISYTSGGFKGDYLYGIEQSYLDISKYIVKPITEKTQTFNIIGSCMYEHNYKANLNHLVEVIESSLPIHFNTSFTNGASISNLEEVSKAKINIVICSSGIKCAEYLKEKHNIDYIYVSPVGYNNTFDMIDKISKKLNINPNDIFIKKLKQKSKIILMHFKHLQKNINNKNVVLSGNYAIMKGYQEFLDNELGFKVKSILINHTKGEIIEEDSRYTFEANESDKQYQIETNKPILVIGDAVLIKISEEIAKSKIFSTYGIQVQNPNLTKKILTDHIPTICFKGADYISEKIINNIT